MSTTTTDRELRDRLEALEAEVKRLSTEQKELQEVLSDSAQHLTGFERREVRLFAWLGRQHDFVKMVFTVTMTALPIAAVAVVANTRGLAPFSLFTLVWMLFATVTASAVLRGARALHLVRAAVRRPRK